MYSQETFKLLVSLFNALLIKRRGGYIGWTALAYIDRLGRSNHVLGYHKSLAVKHYGVKEETWASSTTGNLPLHQRVTSKV